MSGRPHVSATTLLLLVLLSATSATAAELNPLATRAVKGAANPLQTTFQSDNDKAYLYLETMQEDAYRDNPRAVRWTDSPENMKKLQDLLAELDARFGTSKSESSYGALYKSVLTQLREAMPTRYEDPNSIFLLRSAANEVFNEIAQQDRSFELPHLGTLPLGTLNARALPIPGSDTKLVVVNSSLFTFAHEIGKIALATIPIQKTHGHININLSGVFFQNSVRHDLQFLIRFSKALEDFANKRLIKGQAPPREFDDPLLVIFQTPRSKTLFWPMNLRT